MSQQRVYDFGALLSQARTKTLAASLFSPGIYAGMQATVASTSLIQLSPGAFMLPNGVLGVEEGTIDVPFSSPALDTDYTLTAEHGDTQAIGGSSITYVLNTGILPAAGSPNPNSLALFYLRYRVAAAPLNQSMITQPPLLRNGDVLAVAAPPLEMQAPFIALYDRVAGINITQTNKTFTGTRAKGMAVANTAGIGIQTLVFTLPLLTRPRRPMTLRLYADIPAACGVSFTLTNSAGVGVTLTPASVTGPVTGVEGTPAASFVIDPVAPDLTDSPPEPLSLGVTVSVVATAEVFLSRLVLEYT